MKPSEVRYKNVLKRGDELVVVNSIFYSHFNCYRLSDQIHLGNSLQNNFQPVQITEEILLSLGFFKHTFSDDLEEEVFVLKGNKEFYWDLIFEIGDYPKTNPNIGVVYVGRVEVELANELDPLKMTSQEDVDEFLENPPLDTLMILEPWRQPIANHLWELHRLQNIVYSLRGTELPIENLIK